MILKKEKGYVAIDISEDFVSSLSVLTDWLRRDRVKGGTVV